MRFTQVRTPEQVDSQALHRVLTIELAGRSVRCMLAGIHLTARLR
jgi:hypothetical protein